MSRWEEYMRGSYTPDGVITTTSEGDGIAGGSWKENMRNAWTPNGLKIVIPGGGSGSSITSTDGKAKAEAVGEDSPYDKSLKIYNPNLS